MNYAAWVRGRGEFRLEKSLSYATPFIKFSGIVSTTKEMMRFFLSFLLFFFFFCSKFCSIFEEFFFFFSVYFPYINFLIAR